MAHRVKKTFKLSDLSDEQIEKLFDEVETDEELSSDSSENEEPHVDFVESENAALNLTSNTYSEQVTRLNKSVKRPRSPLPSIESFGPTFVPSSGGFNGSDVNSIMKDTTELSKIIWRQQSMQLHVNEIAFQGDSSLPSEILELETPLQIFIYFFTNDIIKIIVEETNRAAIAKNVNTQFKADVEDIHRYIGILLYMSIYRYPNLRSYWGKNTFEPIANCMSRSKFEAIKQFLSFRDESQRVKKGQLGYDPLFRIRGFADKLNVRFDSVPKNARLCVDEQMCSTKIKHHLRQYMPNKPHKWGIKLFVLCDSFGYAYRFEIYSGAGDNVILPNLPNLGASANVVVRLSQTVKTFVNHIIYFDNFYTTVPLLVYLHAKGIHSLGTVRVNRIPNCKLPPDNNIKDQERGFLTEYVGSVYGVGITNVLWKDNKAVRLLSTYVGAKPFIKENSNNDISKIPRYDRKSKRHIEIDCPQIIREYNCHMGGVDLMDGLMGRYHIRAKTRDAATRLFYHLVDMAATNAYILYRRIQRSKFPDSFESSNNNMFKLPEFREAIAAGLVAYKEKKLPGRPSVRLSHVTQTNNIQPNVIKIGSKTVHPVADVRYDNLNHYPLWLSREGGKKWCKLCKKSQTQCFFSKCKIHLCCSNTKNCFFDYHNHK